LIAFETETENQSRQHDYVYFYVHCKLEVFSREDQTLFDEFGTLL
jgi:hypothetical protein